jgi:HEAT repeats
MPGRRRAVLWIAGILGVAAVASLSWVVITRYRDAGSSAVVYDGATPLPVLTKGLREGDARALLLMFPRLTARMSPTAKAVTEDEAKELIEILESTRAGFLRFGGYGRVSSLMLVTKVLERFGVEKAPACWFQALRPAHDLFASGLADADLQTRTTALNEVGQFWSWFPGRTMMSIEEDTLLEWKEGLYAPVLRRLGDREAQARAAAVACLGNLADDEAADDALRYLEDKGQDAAIVRQQVLVSFAQRSALLTEDVILKRLHDAEPAVAQTAELILKSRGLTSDQIELGRLIFDPRAEHRASVIPQLRNRTDIDPVIWLLQLSRDENESVRMGAAQALAERPTPEVLQRLAEMARTDQSPTVRQAVGKLVASSPKAETATALPMPLPLPRSKLDRPAVNPEATVALPPLPGSPSLNPKAN